jgi:hypothetical protein
MYNPDQHYQAHALHLKDLSEQAEQCQMIAALTQYWHARVHAAGRWLGALWVRLGTWLAHSTLRDEQPMRHEAARVQKASLCELAGCTSTALAGQCTKPRGQMRPAVSARVLVGRRPLEPFQGALRWSEIR